METPAPEKKTRKRKAPDLLPLEARLIASPDVRAFLSMPEESQTAIRTLVRPPGAPVQ